MAWTMVEGGAAVHSNSGEFTYGGSLCQGVPTSCNPYINHTIKAELTEDTANFDAFIDECGKISKSVSFNSCNMEALVMWFNQGDNKHYNSVLDDNSIFDIKNVDDCEHIIYSKHNIRTGDQSFEDSSYDDSGYPCIATDPCNSTSGCKYNGSTTGHKIKYHVTSEAIPANFYQNHDELVELYFPHLYTENTGSNTRKIGQGAFKDCTRLSAITFSQVEEIDSEAFAYCQGLKKIDWGHVNCCTSNLKKIGAQAFYECNELECILLPDTVTSLGESAFSECYNVEKIHISEKLTKIPDFCFYRVGNLVNPIEDLYIPNGITEIGERAFADCKASMITVGDGITDLTKIGDNAFRIDSFSFHVDFRFTMVDDYNNIIQNLNRIFDGVSTAVIDFYMGDDVLASELNSHYSGGESDWTFHALSEYPQL